VLTGVQGFIEGLRELGHAVETASAAANLVVFPYTIPVGARAGEQVRLAFTAPTDWPSSPPSGPCVSPRILRLHPDQSVGHPIGGVHPADHLGPEWEYWSRPFPGWPQTDRSARAYMAHIRNLFATL
jgi:hypothetical protein